MKERIYLIGSLRNPRVPEVGDVLRAEGWDVFDDWYAAGPEADDYWQKYSQERGQSYTEALADYAAQHTFEFDKRHLDLAHIGVLVLPAGKSGHLELGYLAGRGKPTYVLMEEEPERWDVMLNFATAVCPSLDELVEAMTNG